MYQSEFSQVGFLLHVTCVFSFGHWLQGVLADLLLLESPLWQFDLVREEVTTAQGMSQPELAPKSLEAMPSLSVPPSSRLVTDLHDKVVVGIAGEAAQSAYPRCRYYRGATKSLPLESVA